MKVSFSYIVTPYIFLLFYVLLSHHYMQDFSGTVSVTYYHKLTFIKVEHHKIFMKTFKDPFKIRFEVFHYHRWRFLRCMKSTIILLMTNVWVFNKHKNIIFETTCEIRLGSLQCRCRCQSKMCIFLYLSRQYFCRGEGLKEK